MYNILMFTPQDILEGMIEKKFYLMYQPIFFHDGVTLYGIEVLLRLKKIILKSLRRCLSTLQRIMK